eukprot:TRINITY_DN101098_c0_g1_i1.p1 TRINITY_DN101098_c0_g1~~TRINITY_DN101098_c0_g1_i1.p1  ORF type:complete len:576 (+),score=112.48 TRINITY_DN101098_c0_g1_i1:235-1962(+)
MLRPPHAVQQQPPPFAAPPPPPPDYWPVWHHWTAAAAGAAAAADTSCPQEDWQTHHQQAFQQHMMQQQFAVVQQQHQRAQQPPQPSSQSMSQKQVQAQQHFAGWHQPAMAIPPVQANLAWAAGSMSDCLLPPLPVHLLRQAPPAFQQAVAAQSSSPHHGCGRDWMMEHQSQCTPDASPTSVPDYYYYGHDMTTNPFDNKGIGSAPWERHVGPLTTEQYYGCAFGADFGATEYQPAAPAADCDQHQAAIRQPEANELPPCSLRLLQGPHSRSASGESRRPPLQSRHGRHGGGHNASGGSGRSFQHRGGHGHDHSGGGYGSMSGGSSSSNSGASHGKSERHSRFSRGGDRGGLGHSRDHRRRGSGGGVASAVQVHVRQRSSGEISQPAAEQRSSHSGHPERVHGRSRDELRRHYGLLYGYMDNYDDLDGMSEDELVDFEDDEGDERLPCGLTNSQLSELLFRDLTPEDYDLLLLLDEASSAPAASSSEKKERVEKSMSRVSVEACLGETCTVCLLAFEENDIVAKLPCQHHFHRECISKWLTERRSACPLCGAETMASEDSGEGPLEHRDDEATAPS